MDIRDQIALMTQQITGVSNLVKGFKFAADDTEDVASPAGSPGWHTTKAAEWQKRADDHDQTAREHRSAVEKHLASVGRVVQKRTQDAHQMEAASHRLMADHHERARDTALVHTKYHADCAANQQGS